MISSVRGSCSALLRTCLPSSSLSSSSRIPRPSTTNFFLRRTYATEVTDKRSTTADVKDALSRSTSLFKTYKPVSPGLRHLKRPLNPHLYEGRPVRLLTIAKRKTGGRNSHGHITVRHRGGGHRQRIRALDFLREEPGVYDVVRIEYDPGRSAHIALVKSRNPEHQGTSKWKYIIATEGMRAGDEVQSFRQGIPQGFSPAFDALREEENERLIAQAAAEAESAKAAAAAAAENGGEEQVAQVKKGPKEESHSTSSHLLALGILRTMTLKPGNVLPLKLMPPGTIIHNIALKPTGPGILVRSAGSFAQVMSHEESGRYTHVKLQSGEIRKILTECCGTVGKVSNTLWKSRNLGKAGRSRWLGWRPSVRGVAMNANDHPHGGGRGKSKSNKHPVSIWGWGTKGTRTRKSGPKGPKNSNKMVVQERPRGKEKRSN